jgi:Zn-dependent protease with chaperone function
MPTPPGETWLAGSVVPTPVPRGYRAALGLVAVAMVLLPGLYLGLIGLIGWATCWHATAHRGWLAAGGSAPVLLYVTPLLVGGIVILFLIKPLFTRPAHREATLALDHVAHPEFFRFLGELCRAIGAPLPARVDVDCAVNASASLRDGFGSLGRHDLVLTLGLPLAAGLSVRQLGGVLAHEFGHFTQGGGMRLSYLVRTINFWFARVVYERDALDLQLDEWARDADFRLALLLQLARGAVWLSRRVLHGLMLLGHAVSCLLMRQMEYDADRVETQVSGSAGFVATSRRLTHLHAGATLALTRLAELWRERRLPDDFPEFIRHAADSLDETVRQQIDAATDTDVTDLWDTHPATSDRMRAAERLGEPGVCQHDLPARVLFGDFSDLCRTVTRAHYQTALGLEVPAASLVSVAELIGQTEVREAELQALRDYLPGWDPEARPLAPDPDNLATVLPPEELLRRIREARQRLDEVLGDWPGPAAEWDRALLEHRRIGVLEQLVAADLRVASVEGIPRTDSASLRQLGQHWETTVSQLRATWDPIQGPLRDRWQAALQLWWQDPPPESDPGTLRVRRDEIATLSRLARELARSGPRLVRLHVAWQALESLLTHQGATRTPEALAAAIGRLRSEVQQTGREMVSPLEGTPYPFSHAQGRIRITDLWRPSLTSADPDLEAYQLGAGLLEHLPPLHTRCVGRLVALALEAERAHGV